MIIDSGSKRSEYFSLPSVSEILRSALPKKHNITVTDLQRHSDRCLVATLDNTLDSLLAHEHETSYDDVIAAARHVDENSLLVLPPEYRVEKNTARNIISYSVEDLTRLDDKEVIAKILDVDPDKAPTGPLPDRRKRELGWTPDRVIRTTLEDPGTCCYTWWGKDRHRRVVSVYRAIEGAELRAFSLLAEYKQRIDTIEEALRADRTQGSLSSDASGALRDELRNKRGYIERIHSENALSLDYTNKDIIPVGRPFRKGVPVGIPSRSRPGMSYGFNLTSVPYVKRGEEDPIPAWQLRGHCSCKDKQYRGYRRPDANDDDFFCAHEIAGFHRLKRYFRENTEYRSTIRHLPFLIPSRELEDFVDTLRYRTVLLTYNEKSQRWSKRRLNHTEMECLILPYLSQEQSRSPSTPDIEWHLARGYDPTPHLIKV